MDPPAVVDVAAAGDPVAAVLAAHRRADLLRVRTSGTSAGARAVLRTTTSWFASFPHVAALTDLGPRSRMWLPGAGGQPGPGTLSLFAAVLAGWAGATTQDTPEGATHAHLTPLQLERSLAVGADVAGLTVTVAGDSLSRGTTAAARVAGVRLSHYYGAAELSFVAWGSGPDDLRPFPGVEVEVRDGEIWARSPYLCLGYDGPPGALRTDPSGWATVGDRGRWLPAERVLRVHGRGEDAVTTGGATVLLADVEATLATAVAGPCAVLGVPHAVLGQAVVVVLADVGDLAPARAAVAVLSTAARPRAWFTLPVLPVTPQGKLDRAALRDAVGSGRAVRIAGATS